MLHISFYSSRSGFLTVTENPHDNGIFKKFSHKNDITRELYYNVYCGNVAEIIQMLPKKEYTLLVADIPYSFRMAGFDHNGIVENSDLS